MKLGVGPWRREIIFGGGGEGKGKKNKGFDVIGGITPRHKKESHGRHGLLQLMIENWVYLRFTAACKWRGLRRPPTKTLVPRTPAHGVRLKWRRLHFHTRTSKETALSRSWGKDYLGIPGCFEKVYTWIHGELISLLRRTMLCQVIWLQKRKRVFFLVTL